VIVDHCQRWTLGREFRRPAGEVIRPSEYEVAELGPKEAKAFVREHHYSGECSPTAHPFGLWRRGILSGAAVFGPLPSLNAHLAVFPQLTQKEALTLGRLVLLDDVPGNGESYFVARCFELLRQCGIVAVESCSDPTPRVSIDGRQEHRGHVGCVYQALNARYVGYTNPASLHLLPDGTILSNRTQGKVRKGERGRSTAFAQLERFGAEPLRRGEDPTRWLRYWRPRLTRALRHQGNHRYTWILNRRRRRELEVYGPTLPYPKIDLVAA
jgi:hypothetical protein